MGPFRSNHPISDDSVEISSVVTDVDFRARPARACVCVSSRGQRQRESARRRRCPAERAVDITLQLARLTIQLRVGGVTPPR